MDQLSTVLCRFCSRQRQPILSNLVSVRSLALFIQLLSLPRLPLKGMARYWVFRTSPLCRQFTGLTPCKGREDVHHISCTKLRAVIPERDLVPQEAAPVDDHGQ